MQGKVMTKQIDDKLHKKSERMEKATKYTNKTEQEQPNPQIHNTIYIYTIYCIMQITWRTVIYKTQMTEIIQSQSYIKGE